MVLYEIRYVNIIMNQINCIQLSCLSHKTDVRLGIWKGFLQFQATFNKLQNNPVHFQSSCSK